MEPGTGVAALPPQAIVMQMVMGGWVSKAIASMSRFAIPDVLKKHGSLTAAGMITNGVNANADALERMLRACASLGIFTESEDGHFGLTPLSEVMTSDHPGSIKGIVELFSASTSKVWCGLGDAVRTGEPQCANIMGADFWSYLQANPAELEDFGKAMQSNSHASLVGVLEKCDFSNSTKVIDVAGGFGHMIIALLEKYPHLKGALLDRPELIPVAKKKLPAPASVASRLEYFGGDMFQSVPPADTYIMKHIMHYWNDDQCVTILSNCAQAMLENGQSGGRVICVDAVLPPMGNTEGLAGKLMDLNMLVFIPGKERTRAQWEEIYARAGLRIASVTPLADNFGTSIVEGRKA